MRIDWRLAAKVKIFKDRLTNWGVPINFLMLACISAGIRLETIHLVIIALILIVVTCLDMKYILPKEQEYYFQRNPEWERLKK